MQAGEIPHGCRWNRFNPHFTRMRSEMRYAGLYLDCARGRFNPHFTRMRSEMSRAAIAATEYI